MKIRVFDSDGVYNGGLFKTDVFNVLNCRVWHAPPHPNYSESLIDIAGKDNPCEATSWYRLQIATVPDISGPPDGSDNFDANSRAYSITLAEASQWLLRYGFTPPADLAALLEQENAGVPDGISAMATPSAAPGPDHPNRATTSDMTATGGRPETMTPLPERARRVWDALAGRILTAKDLANELRSNELAIRKQIYALQRAGRPVTNRRGAGYYREDAPPPA
jgi:hypothetical protein